MVLVVLEGGVGMERKRKKVEKTHGHGQQGGDCRAVRGLGEVEGGIEGIRGDGKKKKEVR